MAPVLGKRKSRTANAEAPTDTGEDDPQAVFRRYFEAQFKPLDVTPVRSKPTPTDDATGGEDGETGSEWGGVSDGDGYSEDEDEEEDDQEAGRVQIVDHTSSATSNLVSTMTKRELKEYMSSRPPMDTSAGPTTRRPKPDATHSSDNNNNEDSAAFLANDLALQRLIAESNILSQHAARSSSSSGIAPTTSATSSSSAAGSAFADGRLRRVTTDMRVRALGARESVLAQRKMPMAIRKGMAGAAAAREARRRREARESGIVLERPAPPKKTAAAARAGRRGQPAVDRPGVGRLRGAELRLSQRDIRGIEGGGRGMEAGMKRRRRR